MSWLKDLYDVYEKNSEMVGKTNQKNKWGQEVVLLPISHTTQTAHIEVTINGDGEYLSAIVLSKDDNRNTIIPCTLESASRSSNIAPYPLHDKLIYVAGDFAAYGGVIKKENPHLKYIAQLEKWALSDESNEKIKIIYSYLKKGRLVEDLKNDKKLYLDKQNKLIEKWDKKYEDLHGEKPKIFSAVTGNQTDAFVRFNVVDYSKESTIPVWYDSGVANSFINFYNKSLTDRTEDICYVIGKRLPITELHANKIRNSADKSKLISSNDSSGYTYRGRFENNLQAVTISYEASQKIHNALKWLIGLQGEAFDQRIFLVWGITDKPTLIRDESDIFSIAPVKKEVAPITAKDYALNIGNALKGYQSNLTSKQNVSILIVDAATTGRLAVTYYQKLHKQLYLERLEKWYLNHAWLFREKFEDKKIIKRFRTPSPKEIATAAYGSRNDKLLKETIERILLCIVEGRTEIPKDIERNLIQRASRPTTMEKWEWEKGLNVTCAMIAKKEGFEMALNNEETNRSYLFGRLLAVADVAERSALKLNEDNRETNAMRYMTAFSNQPEKTWKIIRENLHPYLTKLGLKGIYFSKIIDEITDKLGLENFNNDRLDGTYLVGLSSQRYELYKKKQTTDEN